MSKKHKKKPHHKNAPAQDDDVALDEALTDATSSLAKGFDKYKMPIVVGIVVLFGLIAVVNVINMQSEAQNRNRNDEFFTAMGGDEPEPDVETVRSEAGPLVDEMIGKDQGAWMASRYAAFLAENGYEAEAVAVFEKALAAHPEEITLTSLKPRYDALKSSLDWTAPVATPPSSDDATGAADADAANEAASSGDGAMAPERADADGDGADGADGADAGADDGDSGSDDGSSSDEPAADPAPTTQPSDGGR